MKTIFKYLASIAGLALGGAGIALLSLLLVALSPLIALFIVAYD